MVRNRPAGPMRQLLRNLICLAIATLLSGCGAEPGGNTDGSLSSTSQTVSGTNPSLQPTPTSTSTSDPPPVRSSTVCEAAAEEGGNVTLAYGVWSANASHDLQAEPRWETLDGEAAVDPWTNETRLAQRLIHVDHCVSFREAAGWTRVALAVKTGEDEFCYWSGAWGPQELEAGITRLTIRLDQLVCG